MDFDGDGRLDLLTGASSRDSAAFHVFRRNEDGSWAPRQRFEVTPANKVLTIQQSSFVTAADWNGDGVPDLLMRAGGYPTTGVLLGFGSFKADGPMALSHEIDFTPKGWVIDFAVADWDRHGKPDLLVRQVFLEREDKDIYKNGIYWYKNLGGPHPSPSGTGAGMKGADLPKLAEGKLLVESLPDMGVRGGFCVGDWNGDEWPDLIVTWDELAPPSPDRRASEWRGTVWVYLRE